MIRVLIAEDHLMVRAGIRALLEKAGDIHVLGEASNGQEAIELTDQLKPDVLIMDIMMPRLNGIQAAENIRDMKLPTQVLLLSMYSDEGFVHQALQCRRHAVGHPEVHVGHPQREQIGPTEPLLQIVELDRIGIPARDDLVEV